MSLGAQWSSGFRNNEGSAKGGEAGKGFGAGTDPEYEAQLTAVAQEMMEKVEAKDRSYHFKTYKNCFIGKVRLLLLLPYFLLTMVARHQCRLLCILFSQRSAWSPLCCFVQQPTNDWLAFTSRV